MQQIHVLSINCILPLCLSVQTHTHTPLWLDRLPRMTKTLYYLLLFIIADGAIISWPRCLSPSSPCICFYLFRPLTLSLFPALSSSLHVYVYSDTSPSFSPPPLTQSLPLCPAFVTRLVSITTATFLSCLTIFNQKQRKTEMRWGRERGREWGRRRLQVRWCIRWLRKQFYPPKDTNRGWGWSAEWKLALTLTVWSVALCGWHS